MHNQPNTTKTKKDFKPIYIIPLLHIGILAVFSILTGCKKDFNKTSGNPSTSLYKDDAVMNTTDRPNIIFILADDFGYEIPQCNGGMSYSTPNLDMMAATGIRFTQAHTTPLCSPSRVMLLTGKYSDRNYTKWGSLETKERTIANMLKDSGYATCFAGKWQLGGGDNSILTFGWDKYSVWLPFDVEYEYLEGTRFKGARIYENGAYLSEEETADVYADDKFTDYIKDFIDTAHSNNQPFLAFYSMNLCHPPMSPTPDDPEYATWNFVPRNGSRVFFPSMVSYMDKKIGEIINHISTLGIQNNTIILFSGDNGTAPNIKSMFNGFVVQGGKDGTDEPGTNVPLLAIWPGTIPGGQVSHRLIDFTDILPTFAEIAGIPKPPDYGILDGISFYGDMTGNGPVNQRSTIYCAYNSDPPTPNKKWVRWVQNDTYKLYDTSRHEQAGQFIRLEKGKPDGPPLDLNQLTPEERVIIKQFARALIKKQASFYLLIFQIVILFCQRYYFCRPGCFRRTVLTPQLAAGLKTLLAGINSNAAVSSLVLFNCICFQFTCFIIYTIKHSQIKVTEQKTKYYQSG